MHLIKLIIKNRAPFEELNCSFEENQISVLSAVNGRGKTTILSHLADALYEMSKQHFSDVSTDPTQLYRISTALDNLNQSKPSFVYFRFQHENLLIDYVDIRNKCSKEDYDLAISLENKIDFDNFIKTPLETNNFAKVISNNFNKEAAEKIFNQNVNIFFPAYRFEVPAYINDPHKTKLEFTKKSKFSGRLNKPIEVVSGLPEIANWIMDVVLDMQYPNSGVALLFHNLNHIITNILSSKGYGATRLGVGQRNAGSSRIQIVNPATQTLIYPSIFSMSSGELSLLCLFTEIIRHADISEINQNLTNITGIVLIDEIDKHLHIKLQKEILPKLLNLFPKVQFIVSSHSPFLNMGLAEICKDRTKVIELTTGLSIDPLNDPEYLHVYEMMIDENLRFKNMYESIQAQIVEEKALQIITEGKNTLHIENAIKILEPDLLEKIKFITGAEGKTGDQQLKNAFEIMKNANHSTKFLFVWDNDSAGIIQSIAESEHFHKFSFAPNEANTIADKGIENLYDSNLFTADLYDEKEVDIGYGGKQTSRTFNKNKFLAKVTSLNDHSVYKNFQPLNDKIHTLLD